MKKIFLHGKLGNGKYVQVDDEDYHKVYALRPWMGSKYPMVTINHRSVFLHHFIYGVPLAELKKQKLLIDHKDRNTMNAQKSNLRASTLQQNNQNTSLRSDNTSGYKGVDFEKGKKKYRARIQHKRIGNFDTPEEAARAYDKAARELFGEYAVLNFEDEHEQN